eukprot:TRINITY_DN6584_c1_g1_i2.p1 TRINITY_DN6584_c1_g1~~TRINITY_DN6584_c1_g1_i2.p1  ORF type:complete len:725 (+),score=183.71 TRINITY_DN6584_c1_g1_i2:647-2821(+)
MLRRETGKWPPDAFCRQQHWQALAVLCRSLSACQPRSDAVDQADVPGRGLHLDRGSVQMLNTLKCMPDGMERLCAFTCWALSPAAGTRRSAIQDTAVHPHGDWVDEPAEVMRDDEDDDTYENCEYDTENQNDEIADEFLPWCKILPWCLEPLLQLHSSLSGYPNHSLLSSTTDASEVRSLHVLEQEDYPGKQMDPNDKPNDSQAKEDQKHWQQHQLSQQEQVQQQLQEDHARSDSDMSDGTLLRRALEQGLIDAEAARLKGELMQEAGGRTAGRADDADGAGDSHAGAGSAGGAGTAAGGLGHASGEVIDVDRACLEVDPYCKLPFPLQQHLCRQFLCCCRYLRIGLAGAADGFEVAAAEAWQVWMAGLETHIHSSASSFALRDNMKRQRQTSKQLENKSLRCHFEELRKLLLIGLHLSFLLRQWAVSSNSLRLALMRCQACCILKGVFKEAAKIWRSTGERMEQQLQVQKQQQRLQQQDGRQSRNKQFFHQDYNLFELSEATLRQLLDTAAALGNVDAFASADNPRPSAEHAGFGGMDLEDYHGQQPQKLIAKIDESFPKLLLCLLDPFISIPLEHRERAVGWSSQPHVMQMLLEDSNAEYVKEFLKKRLADCEQASENPAENGPLGSSPSQPYFQQQLSQSSATVLKALKNLAREFGLVELLPELQPQPLAAAADVNLDLEGSEAVGVARVSTSAISGDMYMQPAPLPQQIPVEDFQDIKGG